MFPERNNCYFCSQCLPFPRMFWRHSAEERLTAPCDHSNQQRFSLLFVGWWLWKCWSILVTLVCNSVKLWRSVDVARRTWGWFWTWTLPASSTSRHCRHFRFQPPPRQTHFLWKVKNKIRFSHSHVFFSSQWTKVSSPSIDQCRHTRTFCLKWKRKCLQRFYTVLIYFFPLYKRSKRRGQQRVKTRSWNGANSTKVHVVLQKLWLLNQSCFCDFPWQANQTCTCGRAAAHRRRGGLSSQLLLLQTLSFGSVGKNPENAARFPL